MSNKYTNTLVYKQRITQNLGGVFFHVWFTDVDFHIHRSTGFVSPEARIKDLEQAPEYLSAKRFVQDPAAERERQRAELLEKLETKAPSDVNVGLSWFINHEIIYQYYEVRYIYHKP